MSDSYTKEEVNRLIDETRDATKKAMEDAMAKRNNVHTARNIAICGLIAVAAMAIGTILAKK